MAALPHLIATAHNVFGVLFLTENALWLLLAVPSQVVFFAASPAQI